MKPSAPSSRSGSWSFCSLGLSVCMLLLMAGCANQTPEEKIATARGEYAAQLTGFLLNQTPLVSEPAPMEADGDGEAAEEPAAASTDPDFEIEDLAPVAVSTTALLDILVQSDSYEELPGLTVDVSLVSQGGEGDLKKTWRVWVDTSGLGKGSSTQITSEIDDVPYEDGDGFYVEVRHPIPEPERGDYREFGAS